MKAIAADVSAVLDPFGILQLTNMWFP